MKVILKSILLSTKNKSCFGFVEFVNLSCAFAKKVVENAV